MRIGNLALPPDHLIHYPRIRLDNLHDFGRDVLIHIVGDRDAMVAVSIHCHCRIYCLQEAVLVNASDEEATFVQGLGALSAGADADSGEGMSDAGEKTAFLWQSATVAHHSKSIHLQTVVIVEAQRLVLDDTWVELEAT